MSLGKTLTKRNGALVGILLVIVVLVGYLSSSNGQQVSLEEKIANSQLCTKICDQYAVKEGRKDLEGDCARYCAEFNPTSAGECKRQCTLVCEETVPGKKQTCATDCNAGCDEAFSKKLAPQADSAAQDLTRSQDKCMSELTKRFKFILHNGVRADAMVGILPFKADAVASLVESDGSLKEVPLSDLKNFDLGLPTNIHKTRMFPSGKIMCVFADNTIAMINPDPCQITGVFRSANGKVHPHVKKFVESDQKTCYGASRRGSCEAAKAYCRDKPGCRDAGCAVYECFSKHECCCA